MDRPKKVNGVMIEDGEIMLRLKWLNGRAGQSPFIILPTGESPFILLPAGESLSMVIMKSE